MPLYCSYDKKLISKPPTQKIERTWSQSMAGFSRGRFEDMAQGDLSVAA
jgi:hypothetical protein